jgi:arabinan endo-1,5-alpha-L-arabinosidase
MNQLSKCLLVILSVFLVVSSCSKKIDPVPVPKGEDTPVITPSTDVFNINNVHDTYSDVMNFSFVNKWGPYNVHDPSIKKFGDYYYCYSTDAAYGNTSPNWGLQIRKSKDLVEWFFVGWVFNNQLPSIGVQAIISSGGIPNNSLWAPYVLKVGAEYRLYYSIASNVSRLSVIGLATASNPEGPWTDKGSVVVSKNNSVAQTNAIDPTVATTPSGEQYMYYGSGFDGIYVLQLNAATGLAATTDDIGKRIANRSYAHDKYYNGNIEAAEVIDNISLPIRVGQL